MRILIASLAAVTAMAFAAPSFAQQEIAPDTTVPAAKPKPGTTAYCNTLKSASSKSACLKRVQAQAPAKAAPAPKAKAAKNGKPVPAAGAAKLDNTASVPAMPPATSTVAIPPLPQKTI